MRQTTQQARNNVMDSHRLTILCRERSCKANGSGCKQIKVSGPSPSDPRKGCITQFSPEEIVALRMSLQAMDRDSKEWFILGILSSCMRTGQKTECSKWKEQRDRTRARSTYCLLTNPVCKVIPAPGLSDVRRRYLFQHIREYVREDRQNLVCPDPAN
ncbi:uncharacterized protein [Littorina saxatilis]|uniref:Uncharacterized protein n=1 Tax=Littorina saxatilis TaxID=31220 RepID=A0AAN9AXZ6_9CAEN